MQNEAECSRRVRAVCRAEVRNLSAWLNRLPPSHPARDDLERALTEHETELTRLEAEIAPSQAATRYLQPGKPFGSPVPLLVRERRPRGLGTRLARPFVKTGRATGAAVAGLARLTGRAVMFVLRIPERILKALWMLVAFCAGAVVRAVGAVAAWLGRGCWAIARGVAAVVVAIAMGAWRGAWSVLRLSGRMLAASMDGLGRGFGFGCGRAGRFVVASMRRSGLAVRMLRSGAGEGLGRARGAWSDFKPRAARAAVGLWARAIVGFAAVYGVSENIARRVGGVVGKGCVAVFRAVFRAAFRQGRAAIPKIASGFAHVGGKVRSAVGVAAAAGGRGWGKGSTLARQLAGHVGAASGALLDRAGTAMLAAFAAVRRMSGRVFHREHVGFN